jgi:hypothetical protein
MCADIIALSGIRTNDANVRTGVDISSLRLLGQIDSLQLISRAGIAVEASFFTHHLVLKKRSFQQ